jgi:hypothetical protein
MTDWQTLYAVTFLVLFVLGRPERWVAAVMAVNFIGSSLLGHNYLAVGILDLFCIAVLIGQSREANIVSALYVAMLPVYVAASALEWSPGTTGILIDLLGYAQLVVMSNVLGGMGGRVRDPGRWVTGPARHPRGARVAPGYPAQVVARDTAQVRKVGR